MSLATVWFSATPSGGSVRILEQESDIKAKRVVREIDWDEGKEMVRGKRTVRFLVLLVLSHGHEASTCGKDFVTKASFVVGLLGISLIIVDLVAGVLSFAWWCVRLMV